MRNQMLACVVVASAFLVQGVVYAWDGPGHETIALMAYRRLSPESKKKVKAILDQHPAKTFFLGGMPSSADPDEYLFVRAATFPDVIRSGQFQQEYNPGHEKNKLHFINKPFVPDSDLGHLATQPHDPGPQEDHIISALEKCDMDLRSNSLSAKDKAVQLSWLIHLIGDIHQPLHCTALYSTAFDQPHGDEGGNKIFIRPHHSPGFIKLHAYWDDLLGKEEDIVSIRHAADRIGDNPNHQRTQLGSFLAHHEYSEWASESYDEALRHAYHIGNLHSTHVLALPLYYEEDALKVATQRAALAGIRLADKIGEIFH